MNKIHSLVAGALALVVLSCASRAFAGGLYLADRGSRALGRGGAFVAGADDGQSLWYNPAGLGFTGRRQLHLDGTMPLYRASFDRVTRDDVNPTPKVDADSTPLPLPTMAYTDSFDTEDWNFGVAFMTPSAVMLGWPEDLGTTAGGVTIPGPTRYSLISMEGSAIAYLSAGIAWHGIEGLSIGAGGYLVASRFHAGMYLNACDYAVACSHPEDPDYEAPATVDLNNAITGTGIFGIIYATDLFRIGASAMLPYSIKGTAKLDVHLPNAAMFDGARVNGDKAKISLDFPMILRGGVELRPFEWMRVEGDVVYEGWSRQKELTISPQNMSLDGAIGIPHYEVGSVTVPRDMQDVFSIRFGGEMDLEILPVPTTVRGGFMWENSSFATKTLTPLTLDSDKFVISAGGSLEVAEGVFLDGMYAHVFIKDVNVRDSIVYPANPLRPGPEDVSARESAHADAYVSQREPIGNGNYTMEADIIGGGIRANF